MARSVPLTEDGVLGYIGTLPQARANFKQLVRELGAKGKARGDLEAALALLAGRGDLVEVKPEQYVVTGRSREYFVGRLRLHRDGYGFLIADDPPEGIEGDIYLNARTASQAMDGDRVVVRLERVDAERRAEGRIVRVLARAHPTVVGEFHAGKWNNYVKPHHDRIRQAIIIPPGEELPKRESQDRIGVQQLEIQSAEDLDGLIVNVEILEYPEGGEPGAGRVVEVLGRPDDFGVDVEIIIRKHHIPHRFPPDVLAQAEAFNRTILETELEKRTDFRGMDVVTIDGETARDFDDAVWVDRTQNGNFLLHVHIADVSHYVRPDSAIDREARMRGTSVYFPDRAVPMLPLTLSTELCSLKPQVDRLTISVLLELTPQGEVVSQEFMRGVIRSVERMTYTSVNLILEGDEALRTQYENLVGRFELMRDLALILNKRRMKRGSIDFDLPEPVIEFEGGLMVGVSKSPRNIAHRLIEEFMLAANEAVAGCLDAASMESIYRVHEAPDPMKVLEFEEMAAQFGYSLGLGPVKVETFRNVQRRRDGRKARKDISMPSPDFRITSRDYQKLINKVEGKPEERIVTYLMLRSMKQARYSEDNTGHFALASDCYTHFTSPIRRYPDLVIHRLLGEWLDAQGKPQTPYTAPAKGKRKAKGAPEEPDPRRKELGQIARDCSITERRADEAERELVEWKKVKFMTNKVGDEFDALVISVHKFGLFLELIDLFVEGHVPVESLPDERFVFKENQRKLVGVRSGREVKIGDRVRVQLDRVDAMEHRLLFSIVEPVAERRKRGRRKS